jgi:hypothetical protein
MGKISEFDSLLLINFILDWLIKAIKDTSQKLDLMYTELYCAQHLKTCFDFAFDYNISTKTGFLIVWLR